MDFIDNPSRRQNDDGYIIPWNRDEYITGWPQPEEEDQETKLARMKSDLERAQYYARNLEIRTAYLEQELEKMRAQLEALTKKATLEDQIADLQRQLAALTKKAA